MSSRRIKEVFIFNVKSIIFAVNPSPSNEPYKGIICFTSTMRITERNSPIFNDRQKEDSESHDESAEKLLESLFKGFNFSTLGTFAKNNFSLDFDLPLGSDQSDYLEYRYPYLYASQLDFDDKLHHLQIPNGLDMSCCDWTERFLVSKRKKKTEVKKKTTTVTSADKIPQDGGKKEPIFNEFILTDTLPESSDTYVLFDIALLLGMTRSRLFNPEVSTRIYNILLPIGRLQLNDDKSPHRYLVIPFLTLHRKPNTGRFRRLVSINLWVIPQNNETCESKPIEVNYSEIHTLVVRKVFGEKLENYTFSLSGSLQKFLTKFNNLESNCTTIDDLLFKISKIIYKKITDSTVGNNIYTQVSLSTEVSLSLITTLPDAALIKIVNEKSIADLKNLQLFDDLKKLLHPNINLNIQDSLAQNKIRIGAEHLFLYSVDFHTSILLLDNFNEKFPMPYYSIKWGAPGITFLAQATSALRTLFYSFHRDSEKRDRSNMLSPTEFEKKLIEDLEEYYVLDIEAPYYKEYFENVKKIIGIDKDYEVLSDRLRTLRELQGLENDEKIANLLLWFTGAVIFITILVTEFSPELTSIFVKNSFSYYVVLLVTLPVTALSLILIAKYGDKLTKKISSLKKRLHWRRKRKLDS